MEQLKNKPERLETIPSYPNPSQKKRPKNSGLWGKLALLFSAAALLISCFTLVLVLGPRLGEPEEETTILYRDHELPVLKGVASNQYDKECFSMDENDWMSYRVGRHSAILGVDVSAYQEDVDWQKVADSGIRFAMIRAGYRGYAKEGVIMPDRKFEQNIQGALDAGLEVGVYFFSQAISEEEAKEEAEYVLSAIEKYDVTYPVAFDWERIAGSSTARTNGLAPEQVTKCAEAFCEEVADAGYTPVVYFNQDLGYLGYQLDRLKDYTFWLAEYNARPSFYYHFDLWQYTHEGKVPGIQGYVDLNLDFRSIPA